MKPDTQQNKKSKIILSIVGLILVFICIIGIAYAAFSYSKTGTKVNSLTTGVINMSYSETSNAISISNAIPMSDDNGKSQTGSAKVFDFTVGVTVSGTATVNYMITAEKNSSSTLPDTAVKVYLTSGSTTETQVLAPTKMSALSKTTSSNNVGAPTGEYILYSGSTTASQTTNYHLRMWLASDYTGSTTTTDPSYRIKVNVYGRAAAL